jgi:tetratricopeptide (TPR) repeat protein
MAVLLVLTVAARGVRAAEPPPPAVTTDEAPADLFHKGLAEYDAHRYGAAIEIFSRVYDQTHSPALLFNIAQARRLMGDCPRAVATYEAFVVADPTSPDVDRARGWLEKLGPCRAPIGEEKAEEKTPGATPEKSAPPPAAAPPSISVQQAAPPRTAAPPRGGLILTGALGGAALMLAGAGAYSAARSGDLSDQVRGAYGMGGTWNAQAAALDHEGKRLQAEAIVLLTAAVLSGAASYLVYRWSSHGDARAR